MKRMIWILPMFLAACDSGGPPVDDAAVLTEMIAAREEAMIARDIDSAMSQFSDDATWINSQGYYFEGKQNVREFHGMLADNATRGYSYEAGEPRIRILDGLNAIAYYPWKMFWFEKDDPDTIVLEEIGLMTLSAQKRGGRWQWIAVTNQHTPWFYETIDPVTVGDE